LYTLTSTKFGRFSNTFQHLHIKKGDKLSYNENGNGTPECMEMSALSLLRILVCADVVQYGPGEFASFQ